MPSALLREQSLHVERPLPWALSRMPRTRDNGDQADISRQGLRLFRPRGLSAALLEHRQKKDSLIYENCNFC